MQTAELHFRYWQCRWYGFAQSCWINLKLFLNHKHLLLNLCYQSHNQNKSFLALTHGGQDKMAAIFQTTFSNALTWMKMYEFRFIIPINNIPALVQIMAWCHPGDKPLSEPRMVTLLMHICVTRSQWVDRGMFSSVWYNEHMKNIQGLDFLCWKLIIVMMPTLSWLVAC